MRKLAEPARLHGVGEVYAWCMSRTNVDIDDEACRIVMARFNLATKREAINLALHRLAVEPMNREEALAMEGTGWDGDLDELRGSRVPE